jgi:hypothetical protein
VSASELSVPETPLRENSESSIHVEHTLTGFTLFLKALTLKGPVNHSTIFDNWALKSGNKLRVFHFGGFVSESH